MIHNTWSNYDGLKADPKQLEKTQKKIGVVFPKEYIEIVLICDGGIPENCSFKVMQNHSVIFSTGLGALLKINKDKFSVLNEYLDPPEFFPKGLVAFGENGGGDYICFDYREGKHLLDPPIVYWDHEGDDGEDVYFIANNFKEFLEKLEPDSDYL
jgi:hypothetical protein